MRCQDKPGTIQRLHLHQNGRQDKNLHTVTEKLKVLFCGKKKKIKSCTELETEVNFLSPIKDVYQMPHLILG